MTTITREERERVVRMLRFSLCDGVAANLLAGRTASALLDDEDIDRVAQALRDAAPQWREVTTTEPALGERVLLGYPTGCVVAARDDLNGQRVWMLNGTRLVDVSRAWPWMPLPAPPAVVAAPVIVSDQDRIATLERMVAELIVTVGKMGAR